LVGLAPASSDKEEIRKLITSTLLSGRPSLVFDNLDLSKKLDSPDLARALTTTEWQDRILGASKEVTLPQRLVWGATGNKMTMTRELVERVCPIRLKPRGGVPARERADRPGAFRHDDLHGWALKNRALLVGAALTLIQHWLEGEAQMMPDGSFARHEYRRRSETRMGSFLGWSEVVGGILAAAGVHGFLGNREQFAESADDETATAAVFLETLASTEQLGETWLTSEVVALAQPGAPLAGMLPVERVTTAELGQWLADHRDTVYGGLELVRSTKRTNKGFRWSVRRVQ
jgi:putative DNA primase/helicase